MSLILLYLKVFTEHGTVMFEAKLKMLNETDTIIFEGVH